MDKSCKIACGTTRSSSGRDTVGLDGLIAMAVTGSLLFAVSCKRQHRRGGAMERESTADEQSDRVEPNPDPRFPRQPDAGPDRNGLWVEQPRETGSVSSTELARAVAGKLDEVRTQCCDEASGACRDFRGRVLLRFTLAPDGAVDEVEVTETSLYEDRFRECLLGRARHWNLIGHSGRDAVEVTVPIRANFETFGRGADSDAQSR